MSFSQRMAGGAAGVCEVIEPRAHVGTERDRRGGLHSHAQGSDADA